MQPLQLVLLWHMHQPDYRNYETGEFMLPWVYLHAIKDYTDMVYHLESHPSMKAVVNFVPVLLDQLEDYAAQFASGQLRDPLLRLLGTPDLEQISIGDRVRIFDSCFRSNHTTMMQPYPAYKRLHDMHERLRERSEAELVYLSGQYLSDLLVWYHLAWTGESVRRNNETVVRLMTQGARFSHADRTQLLNLIGELIQGLIPRYRKLAESGQIELSTTPHYHPLAPLLIDFSSARDSMPGVNLPTEAAYPGGKSRVASQLASAIATHSRRFGARPCGVWPAEGAVSAPFLEILAEQDCQWSASGEVVLANSLRESYPAEPLPERGRYLYRAYRVAGKSNNVICFFRDERLSDMIGFEYSKWFGRDAAEHLVHSLEDIGHNALPRESPVVSVILDGENAWEYYPYNGYYFLNDLYEILENHPVIRTTTYRDYIASAEAEATVLPVLAAGSWVYGTFSTWIGDKEKNQAWDLLCAAKHSYDLVMQSGRLTEDEKAKAERQLASCESSDWFWWLGDYNPPHVVESFDKLFRANLANLYCLLKLPVPVSVREPISQGVGGTPESGGAMRRAS
ncbi:glycoside hydrolase family 57 protein [Nitrosovibrio tenuis]|uniref:Alpha-amylase/alpha-mannosidase, GH57 family n=1 Tax=Nitrosovibrio tenuis TaxID=1233 RepID=A0A1H7H3V7_9PROT|nr:glycoside hydrolase family 57 protein [Nitrosovibrio tenuis]SEK45116.1 Alpha-amylase/alpha-mannosidase, GH57 family [Nitrosovibrio tenuis]